MSFLTSIKDFFVDYYRSCDSDTCENCLRKVGAANLTLHAYVEAGSFVCADKEGCWEYRQLKNSNSIKFIKSK